MRLAPFQCLPDIKYLHFIGARFANWLLVHMGPPLGFLTAGDPNQAVRTLQRNYRNQNKRALFIANAGLFKKGICRTFSGPAL
jgi:hypothetical protein